MNSFVIARALERARREAGMTQAEVAARMGTSQPNISRAESGLVMPTTRFVERYSRATGKEIRIRFGERRLPDRRTRARRVREGLGDYVFNPWDREPTEPEARSLEADGLTREYFERQTAARRR